MFCQFSVFPFGLDPAMQLSHPTLLFRPSFPGAPARRRRAGGVAPRGKRSAQGLERGSVVGQSGSYPALREDFRIGEKVSSSFLPVVVDIRLIEMNERDWPSGFFQRSTLIQPLYSVRYSSAQQQPR